MFLCTLHRWYHLFNSHGKLELPQGKGSAHEALYQMSVLGCAQNNFEDAQLVSIRSIFFCLMFRCRVLSVHGFFLLGRDPSHIARVPWITLGHGSFSLLVLCSPAN